MAKSDKQRDNQRIDLKLDKIYKVLCPDCQRKVRDMIKDKLTDQFIEEALEGKDE